MTSRLIASLFHGCAIASLIGIGFAYAAGSLGGITVCVVFAIVFGILTAAARQMNRVVCVLVLATVPLAASCAAPFGAGSIEHWPARDELYARHCALEVRQGHIKASEFDDCLHRLKVHRGGECTCRRAK